MTLATVHAWYVMNGTDVISADVLFQAWFFLAFQDPWVRYEYVAPGRVARREEPQAETDLAAPVVVEGDVDEDQDEDDEQAPLKPTASDHAVPTDTRGQTYPFSLAERIPWVLNLLSCIRLNNWRIGHKSHDAVQPPPPGFRSRKAFLLQSIISFTRGYVVLDLARAYISYDAYFTDTDVAVTSPLSWSTLGWIPPQLVRSMVVGAQAWALISQIAYLTFLIPVGLNAVHLVPNAVSPHTWVAFFGSPSVIFRSGVRGFWGGYWHQTMRWMTSGPGYAISDVLRLRERSVARYGVISVSAFLLSGITHVGLVPPEPLHASVSANTIRLNVATFFWLQPVAMMAEVVVIKVLTRTLSPRFLISRQASTLRAVLNALWVLAWFSLCIPLLGEAGRQLGYWRVWTVPISLWKAFCGEGWVAWPFLVA